MSCHDNKKEFKENINKTDVVEMEVEQPIVHVRTKRSNSYIKHEIPVIVTKKETHVYHHYYEYDVTECVEQRCEHVYLNEKK